MLMAEVSGGQVGGRPRLVWMVGMKVVLGSREMAVEAVRNTRKIGRSGEPLCICRRFSATRSCTNKQ